MQKILIVDDSFMMRTMIKNIMSNAGYEVIGEASNGIEAINKYKDIHPDLVTMDITMPELNGIEALKGIREIDKNAKVVMCTAMGQKPMVLDAVKNGAKDFVVKPFSAKDIVRTVDKALR